MPNSALTEILSSLQSVSTHLAAMAVDIAVIKSEQEHMKYDIARIKKAVFEDNGSPCVMTRMKTVENTLTSHMHNDCEEETTAQAEQKRRREISDKVKIAVYSSLAVSIMWWLLGQGLLPAVQNLLK